MSNVYLTLVSDVTSDYASNVANKFKVKSKLRLPGEGWKVSIVSAVLPKMALFKNLQSETKNLMELWHTIDGVNILDSRKKGWFNVTDLKDLEKQHKCRTGVEFMNELKNLLNETRDIYIPRGKDIKKGQWTELEWKREVGEPELIMQKSDPTTSTMILKKLPKSMVWIKKTGHVDYQAGRNLIISYPDHTRKLSELSTGEPTKLDASWLYLSSKSEFRMINLNTAFEDALNLHARPLSVTAKVTANSNSISQSLGQVYYAPQGRERALFTPPVEEWYEVQTNHWDEVELSLKELDDNLVEFQPDSQCLIRLHFKKHF